MKKLKEAVNAAKAKLAKISNTKKLADTVVQEYAEIMRPGKWYLCSAEKIMIMHSGKAGRVFFRESLKNVYSTYGYLKCAVKNTLLFPWRKRIPKRQKNTATADCVMISIVGDVYFFDFENQQVEKHCSQCFMAEGYRKLEQAGYWRFFSSPVIWIKGSVVCERIIHAVDSSLKEEEKYCLTQERYRRYLENTPPVGKVTLGEIADQLSELGEYFNVDALLPPAIREVTINLYVIHGDVGKLNTICTGNNELTMIDYVRVCECAFFYDMLSWPLQSIWLRSNWDIWDHLLDSSSGIAKLFDSILIAQGITPSPLIKNAMLILSAGIFYRFRDREPDRCLMGRYDEGHIVRRMKILADGLMDRSA